MSNLFVSYQWCRNDGAYGFGNATLAFDRRVKDVGAINEITEAIRLSHSEDANDIAILYWRRLEE